jgi:hypothetical protein
MPGYSFFYGSADYKIQKDKNSDKISNLALKYPDIKEPLQKVFLNELRDSLRASFEESVPFWYGTKYDFNGTSQIPQRGKIACGYFVSGILADIGFQLNKRKFGQMSSEQLIRKIIHKNYIKRFSKISADKFWHKMEKLPDGIFIIGLDTHIGFLRKNGNEFDFIHASRLGQSCVLSENAKQSRTIKKSKVKIIGLLSEDVKTALPGWFFQKKFL